MAVALFIAGNFWLAAAIAFGFGSRLARTQPDRYALFSSDFWYDPKTYYMCLAMLVLAAAVCFILSVVVWRREHHPRVRASGAAGAFPVMPVAEQSSRGA